MFCLNIWCWINFFSTHHSKHKVIRKNNTAVAATMGPGASKLTYLFPQNPNKNLATAMFLMRRKTVDFASRNIRIEYLPPNRKQFSLHNFSFYKWSFNQSIPFYDLDSISEWWYHLIILSVFSHQSSHCTAACVSRCVSWLMTAQWRIFGVCALRQFSKRHRF